MEKKECKHCKGTGKIKVYEMFYGISREQDCDCNQEPRVEVEPK